MKTTGKAKNETSDYAERYIDQFSMVVVKTDRKTETRFEEQVVNMLNSALNGLMFPTCDGDRLRADIETVLYRLEARLSYSCDYFAIEKLTRSMSPGCEDSKNVAHEFILYNGVGPVAPFNCLDRLATISFIPVQGIFVRNDNPDMHLFATPFFGDRIGWADVYNNTLAEKGGEE